MLKPLHMNEIWSRRQFVQTAFATGAGLTIARFATATATTAQGEAVSETPVLERHLELAQHAYQRDGQRGLQARRGLPPNAVESLRHVMRDHRSGEAHDIDLTLYDQLHDLARAARCEPRFEIISGYRSPASNASMAAREQVASPRIRCTWKVAPSTCACMSAPAPTCATLRWLPPRAAWVTTVAPISSMSIPVASAPGTAEAVLYSLVQV